MMKDDGVANGENEDRDDEIGNRRQRTHDQADAIELGINVAVSPSVMRAVIGCI